MVLAKSIFFTIISPFRHLYGLDGDGHNGEDGEYGSDQSLSDDCADQVETFGQCKRI